MKQRYNRLGEIFDHVNKTTVLRGGDQITDSMGNRYVMLNEWVARNYRIHWHVVNIDNGKLRPFSNMNFPIIVESRG